MRILVAKKPTEDDFADWMSAEASELIWGIPDAEEKEVLVYLDKLAARLGLGGSTQAAPRSGIPSSRGPARSA